MSYLVGIGASSINLQASLSTSTSGIGDPPPGHHPITCSSSTLELAEDGTLACEHAQAPPDDPRTQACLDATVAILLIELLREKENPDVVPG